MGSIHSQLLPSPKSVGGWGSASDPPPPIARESAFALASLTRWRERRQFPSSSADYRSIDFRSIDFRSIDFRSINFRSIDFRSIDFRSIDFRSNTRSPDAFRGIIRGYFGGKVFVLGHILAKLWHAMCRFVIIKSDNFDRNWNVYFSAVSSLWIKPTVEFGQ